MNLYEILAQLVTVAAIFLGPILALRIQRRYEAGRLKMDRKLNVFKELMATRGIVGRTSPRHVDALNAIEVEFSGDTTADKKVLSAWRLYLDHLNTPFTEGQFAQWSDKKDDLLMDLLLKMSQTLNYDFDRVSLKKNVYTPTALGELEGDQYRFRKLLVELMEGKRLIWTGVTTGDRPLEVRHIEEPPGPFPNGKK